MIAVVLGRRSSFVCGLLGAQCCGILTCISMIFGSMSVSISLLLMLRVLPGLQTLHYNSLMINISIVFLGLVLLEFHVHGMLFHYL